MTTSSRVIVTVLYPRQGMSSFDMNYYLNHHIATTGSIWGPYGMQTCTVAETSKESEYAIAVTMMWKDIDAWTAAQDADDTQKKIMNDIENFRFTNVKPITIVGTIVS